VTSEYVLQLPWPKPPLSLNDRHANQFAERRAQVKAHTEVVLVAAAARNAGRAKPFDRATVELIYYPGNNNRRDADNMAATLKPVLDGLVTARLLPDDKANHVLRTSQRIVLRQDDPYSRKSPAVFLVVREVVGCYLDFRHVLPDGEGLQ
jgi:crossover junction endodeoxyribonuclease RusA